MRAPPALFVDTIRTAVTWSMIQHVLYLHIFIFFGFKLAEHEKCVLQQSAVLEGGVLLGELSLRLMLIAPCAFKMGCLLQPAPQHRSVFSLSIHLFHCGFMVGARTPGSEMHTATADKVGPLPSVSENSRLSLLCVGFGTFVVQESLETFI